MLVSIYLDRRPYSMIVYKQERLTLFLSHAPARFILLSALVSAVGILFPSFWFLTIIGTSVYLFLLWRTQPTVQRALFFGLLFGSVTSGAGVWWFWHTLPVTWIGIPDGPIQYLVIFVAWISATFALALPHTLFAALAVATRGRALSLLTITLAWPLLEWARMFVFSAWVLAPESLLESYFSIAGFGNVLAEAPLLLQFASLGGVYALHAVFGALCASIALFLFSLELFSRRLLYISIGTLATTLAIPFWLNYTPVANTDTARVALVSLAIPAGSAPDMPRIARIMASFSEVDRKPEVIVFPEGYRLSLVNDPTVRRILFQDTDALLINSLYIPENDKEGYGSIEFESTTHGIVGSHNKTVLVPLGEYLPSALQFLYTLLDGDTLESYLTTQEQRRTLRGSTATPFTYDGVTYGALLCSEILSPEIYRSLANDGAQILINVANNAWFHGSPLVYEKTLQLAKIHAVYSRKYFLTASNQSPSFVISPQGVVVAETRWGEEVPLVFDVPL